MADSHINSGIANRIDKLIKHKQALHKQIQEIDHQIHILTQAAKIMGEIANSPPKCPPILIHRAHLLAFVVIGYSHIT